MTTPPIPPAMREAAARAWYNLDHKAGTDWWAGASITERAIYLTKAEAALAAALGVCEVREQEGLRLDWVDQNGGLAEDWENNRSGWARNAVRLHQHCEATRPDYPARASLIRRLVITSPTEQVDP